VDHQTLRRFIAHLMQGEAKKSSIARKLSAIRSFFRYLNREEILTSNPARLVATPRREKRLPSVLTADDALRLMEAPHAITPRITTPCCETALSGNPLLHRHPRERTHRHEREDIDRHDSLVRIRGKGRRERIVPIGSKALAAIDAYLGCLTGSTKIDAVFVGPSGKRLTARTVQRILENHRKKTGSAAKGEPAHAPAQLCHALA